MAKTASTLVVANPAGTPDGIRVLMIGDREYFPGDVWDGPDSATDELVASGHLVPAGVAVADSATAGAESITVVTTASDNLGAALKE
jgi:hypothetical protein